MFEPISIDPHICSGKPHIQGKRFPMTQIVDLIAYGSTVEQILDDFLSLESKDILQALLFTDKDLV